MTQKELENYKKRLYELRNLSILSTNKKDYKSLAKYMNEILKIQKILKKAEKEAKKNENRKN